MLFIQCVPALAPGERIRIVVRNPTASEVAATFSSPHTITFHQLAWPQWHSAVDGSEAGSGMDSIGRMTVRAGVGSHIIQMSLETSTAELIGNWISLFAIALSCLWGGWGAWKRAKDSHG